MRPIKKGFVLGFVIIKLSLNTLYAATESSRFFDKVEAPPPAEMLQLRDPFKSPSLQMLDGVPKTELETIPIDQFKLLAVITGPERMRAMLSNQAGKNFFVGLGTKIGVRKGVVRKISRASVKVRERVVNILGQEEDIETEIRLPDNKMKVTASSLIGSQPQAGAYR
jgi:Tfp pilus assembly protein PilP